MRIAVIGAGGVGGYFGGRLAQAGHEMVVVARGAHLQAMRAEGLRVELPDNGSFVCTSLEFSESGEGCAPVELVLVCVKTWQLEDCVPIVERLSDESTVVLPLLNGVDAHETLGARLAPARILGGYCKIIAAIREPGVIRHVGAEPTIHLGALSPEQRELAARVGDALDVEGITCHVDEDVLAGLWKKYLFVSSWGTVGAVSRAPIGAIRTTPQTRELLVGLMAENLALGRARGLELSEELIDKTMAFVDSLPAVGTASMQRDIAEGRRSELESWTGAAVRMSDETGCPAPLHRALYAALLPLERHARGEEVDGF